MEQRSENHQIRRIIAEHDASGQAQFIDDVLPCIPLGAQGNQTALVWVTGKVPADNMDPRDLAALQDLIPSSGIVPVGGTLLRIIDVCPNSSGTMHRTRSVDYVMITKGSLDLELDSGATRVIRQGDIVIQRGTNHRWVNRSGEWAQMLAIPVSALPVVIDGHQLDETPPYAISSPGH
jgi:quercetin dioxygenase-like cupin family protein